MLWVFSLKGSPTKKEIAEFPAPKPPQTVIELAGPIVKADKISLSDYMFNPPRISVAVGEKVTFANTGKTPHNATGSQGGGWDTGLLDAGQSASVTFNEPGTYNYICTPHPFMVGQIIVTGQKLAGKPSVVVDAPNLEKAAVTKMDMPAMEHGSH